MTNENNEKSEASSSSTPVQPPQEDSPDVKNIKLLISGVRVAQSKGAYTLEEAGVLLDAIKHFVKDTPTPVAQ